MAYKKWFWFSLTITLFAQAWFLRPSLAATEILPAVSQFEVRSECEKLIGPETNRAPAITGSAILSTDFVSWAAGFESQLSNVMQ